MSGNRIDQEDIQAGVESIKAEMAAWAGVQNTILEVLEGHTDLLGKINRAVQRQDSGESDPLGELLRRRGRAGSAGAGAVRAEDRQRFAAVQGGDRRAERQGRNRGGNPAGCRRPDRRRVLPAANHRDSTARRVR